jgi:hypothetical protein
MPFFADPNVYLAAESVDGLTSTSSTISSNVLLLRPIRVPKARTFTQICFEITSPGLSGALVRVGLYDCDDNMHPLAPLFDSGDLVPSISGLVTVSCSLNLVAKPYYLAWISSGSFGARTWSGAQCINALGVMTNSSGFVGPIGYLTYSKPYGALPDLTSDSSQTAVGFSGPFVAMAIR